MELQENIKELINFLLILIPCGCAARCIYCIVFITINGEDAKTYKTRMINAIVFTIIAESIVSLFLFVSKYFN